MPAPREHGVASAQSWNLTSAHSQLKDPNNSSLLVTFLDQVCQVALAAVVTVRVHSHEHAGAAQFVRALAPQASDFIVGINLVELEYCELHLFTLVLYLLGLGVRLLLALLSSTFKLERQEDGRLIDQTAVVAQHLPWQQRAAPKGQTLVSCWHTARGSNVILKAGNSRLRAYAHRDCMPSNITNEDLHPRPAIPSGGDRQPSQTAV